MSNKFKNNAKGTDWESDITMKKNIKKLEAEFYPSNLNLREKELYLMGYKKGIEECGEIIRG